MDAGHFLLLAKAALIGVSIAAPVGPIGLLCIQRSLDQGPRVGLATGLGAACADALYGAIGAYGVSAVIGMLDGARTPLALGGAVFLCWLAWDAWHGSAPKDVMEPTADKRESGIRAWQAFGATFLLTLSNPATILSFIAVFSSLAAGSGNASPLWMVGGVFLGSAAWWLILVGLVGLLRERLQTRHLRLIRRTSAVLLTAFAAYQISSLL